VRRTLKVQRTLSFIYISPADLLDC